MNSSKGVVKFIAFIYPYILYHLFFLVNWFTWAKVQLEINTLVLVLIIICVEYLLSRALRRDESSGKRGTSFLINIFFLTFPIILIPFLIRYRNFLWGRWFMSFFYVNHAVLLDFNLLEMLLLGVASILVAVGFYFIFKSRRILLGFYLPWLIFMSPIFVKYLAGGVFGGDISRYKFIEPVVDPIKKLKESVLTPPGPRGLFIENDTIYAVYESTVHASFAEQRLFIYKMDIGKLYTRRLPGAGVRSMFSRLADPYIYLLIWKWNPGFYRASKAGPGRVECLIDLAGGTVVDRTLERLYQIGNAYVDKDDKAAYLLSDSSPAVGKYYFDTRDLVILDLTNLGLCPAGSYFGFAPSVEPEERYLYAAATNCLCGVIKIDMESMDVVGCYEVKSPIDAFYGVVVYKDGLIYAFPVVKHYKTLVLDAKSMRLVKESESPPFHYIRSVVEIDSEHLLCLGFFGDLAVFNIRTGRYTTLIRKNLSFSMGLFKYGDYVYFNTAKFGILRIKIKDILELAQSN